MQKGHTTLVIVLAIEAFFLSSFVTYANADSVSDHWQIGHDDACNTGQVAPGSHTQDYMNGFNQGLIDCHNGKNFGSEGTNGDFTCANPNQSGPGCPNDRPTDRQQHTPEYLQGYKTGQKDGKTGIYDPGSFGAGMTPKQADHWLQGYKDGYKSICGTTYNRQNPPCNGPPS